MALTLLNARCLCGSTKHELAILTSDLPLNLTLCHCDSCRYMTGTLRLTVAVLPASYNPSSALITTLQIYEFSKRITDYSCSTCGTHMFFHVKHGGETPNSHGYWAVHTGTLEQVDGILEADVHWFVADTLDGGFADFLPSVGDRHIPRYAGFKGKSELLPLHRKSMQRRANTGLVTDKLRCHCICGGIQFWIASPSQTSREALRECSVRAILQYSLTLTGIRIYSLVPPE